jgi:hypothetical protein
MLAPPQLLRPGAGASRVNNGRSRRTAIFNVAPVQPTARDQVTILAGHPSARMGAGGSQKGVRRSLSGAYVLVPCKVVTLKPQRDAAAFWHRAIQAMRGC